MQSFFNVGVLTLLWVVNLFVGTGLDAVYHVTDIAKIIIIIITAFSITFSFRLKGDIRITASDFNVFSGMTLIFIGSSILHGYGTQVLDYLWVFCLIYVVSKIEINQTVMFWTGIIYGFLGAVILYIYNYGSLLKGWNENTIAMLGMHSFLIFIIPFFNRTQHKNKIILFISVSIFSFFILPTDSRSGILFLIIATLFALNILPRDIIRNKDNRIIFLALPLLIAFVCTLISKTPFFNSLEQWSFRNFNKPIFNGRDQIWDTGFKMLFDNLLFGCGNLITYNWHNSAIHCLTAYGILGYGFWLASFNKILSHANTYFSDYIVTGCFISFIVLWVQQSVELGFISQSPSLLPYIILGIMLGRINYLKTEQRLLNPEGENYAKN